MAETAGKELYGIAHLVGGRGVLQIAAIDILDIVVTTLDTADVDRLTTAALLVLKNQYRAVSAEDIDQIQPVLEPFVRDRLVVLTRVVDQQ